MNPSKQILLLVATRFLCKRNNDLTWVTSPKTVGWFRDNGVTVSNALLIAHSDEMLSMRDLRNHEVLIHSRYDYFAEVMRKLVETMPGEVDRYTALLRPDEYRILLVYAGREVYDFFARDHRFGPPPRGKIYRSNLRGAWKRPPTPRPDNAIRSLGRKISVMESYGADTTDLRVELERRKACAAKGEDPMAAVRRGEARSTRIGPDEAIERVRARALGVSVPSGWALAQGLSSDAESTEEVDATDWGKGPRTDGAPGEW